MIRVVHLFIALGIFSFVLNAQDDPLAWFPLQVGRQWTYEHEWKSGDPRRPRVERWTTEESITGWVTIPEGLVVVREVRRRSKASGQAGRVLSVDGRVQEVQSSSDGGFVVSHQTGPYLVRGSCIYVIDDGFDQQSRRLSPSYQKYLAEGTLSPDFCFPLQTGRRWGNTDIPWRVEPARNGADYPKAIHIVSDHFGSGGWKDVWFQKGIGVIAERYLHKGSYDEYTKRLSDTH